MPTITLVATKERILSDFPSLAIPDTGITSADYQVRPDRCTDPLGRWLVKTISSTDRKSEGSRCILLYPFTQAGKRLRTQVLGALEGANTIANQADHVVIIDKIRGALDAEIQQAGAVGGAFFDSHTRPYRWPVFGSAAAWGALTPEAYFDACADHIRTMGVAILAAGKDGQSPPDGITARLAGGEGLRILSAYREAQQCAKT